jgi:hypothetical protein
VRIITIRRREFDNISPLFQPGELKTTLVRISGRQQNTPGRMPMSLEIQPLEIKQWLKDSKRQREYRESYCGDDSQRNEPPSVHSIQILTFLSHILTASHGKPG